MSVPHYKGVGLRVTQRAQSFCYLPIPSKEIVDLLGYQNLEWEESASQFAGFNRDIQEKHVQQIITGLRNDDTLQPNPIIAYVLSEFLEFSPIPGSTSPMEAGEITLSKPDAAEDNDKIGFVIDGQHRVEALRRLELEEGEQDLCIGVVLFRAPEEEDERAEFDRLVLEQMEIINSARPLADGEKLLVQQRLDTVSSKFGPAAQKRSTANLIIKQLDSRADVPVEFSAASKKPPKGLTWLRLAVWVNALAPALDRHILHRIFSGDYSEEPERRKKSVKVLALYFRAIEGIIRDKKYWRTASKSQRLYHNVGMGILLLLLDRVNNRAKAFSSVDPGKVMTQNDEDAIVRLQKALKPIRLVDWSVGAPDPKDLNDISALGMAGIQQQKGIPENLRTCIESLMDFCEEIEDQKVSQSEKFVLEVRDSAGVYVCKQEIDVSLDLLDELNKKIENKQFL